MAWLWKWMKLFGFAVLIIGLPGLWLGRAAGRGPAAVQEKIDWPAFMAGHDLVWTRLPGAYGERPFLGNGQLGTMIYQLQNEIRVPLGRPDIHDHRPDSAGWAAYSRPRFMLGEFALQPVGKITGGSLRLDLWNAEVRGEILTDKGTIALTQFVPSGDMGVVTVLRPSAGEAGCHWTWIPGEAKTTRHSIPYTQKDIEAFAKSYGPHYLQTLTAYEPNPGVRFQDDGRIRIGVQDLLAGGQYAVAWLDAASEGGGGSRVLYVGTGNSYPRRTAAAEAAEIVKRLAGRPLDAEMKAHRVWWHAYYPASFVTLPDARWEGFYWIQMYKLASATRPGRTMMDTSGPWNTPTPWPYITWDLNVQLCYWPVVASNRVELGMSLIETLSRNQKALAGNVRPKEWQADSAYIPVASAQDLIAPRDGDMRYFKCVGNLAWAIQNAWMMYRAVMDDRLLRDDIFPLLRRSINLYLHLLEEGPDGELHLPETYSPEYGSAPDCNYDLALLRWGCRALLWSAGRLKIDDPLAPKWRDVLRRLTPYPVDERQGFLIGRGVPFARSHRHFSHLLMVYPLYLVNADQPAGSGLIEKSVRHWIGKAGELMGYSFTGASSMMSALGKGDEALTFLEGLNSFLQPNTMYIEGVTSPCLETPLSAAQSIHDMLLQCWGGPESGPEDWGAMIRVFPAVPSSWPDVRFHDLRAEGAFLISASRKGGVTEWVRIKSLAGEPCRIRPSLAGEPKILGNPAIELKPLGGGAYELGLKKGEEVVLYAGPKVPDVVIEPLPHDPARSNSFGLR